LNIFFGLWWSSSFPPAPLCSLHAENAGQRLFFGGWSCCFSPWRWRLVFPGSVKRFGLGSRLTAYSELLLVLLLLWLVVEFVPALGSVPSNDWVALQLLSDL
jgi:hypothetical protein